MPAKWTQRAFVLLQHLLPQRLLTAAAGVLARSELLAGVLIPLFIRHYRVNMNEALHPDPASYRSFNAFFTRQLRAGARPLATGAGAVLCPADGVISESGMIGAEPLRAKRSEFDTASLLGGDAALARQLAGGSFVTIYLSPRDYHRVHMPLGGRLARTRHVPGKLFSVNAASTALIPGLFCRNERLICEFETGFGRFVVVMVGAMIVAGIRAAWDEPGREGRLRPPERSFGGRGPQLEAGAELGRFELGSTVIVLFPPDTIKFAPSLGERVQMGQKIGALLANERAAQGTAPIADEE